MSHARVTVESVSVPGRLAPVSFTVEPGQAVALVGTNGTGKTTLLRMLAGLDAVPRTDLAAASPAKIRVNGAAPNRRDADFRALTAALLDSTQPDPSLTFGEHAAVLAASWGRRITEAFDSVAAALKISHLRDRFPHECSSGERQLMRLTLVLARPAALLLLDEPEQRLSRQSITALAAVLNERLRAGATLIMATHRDDLVAAVGATAVHMVPASGPASGVVQ